MSCRHVYAEMEARKEYGKASAVLLPSAGDVPILISVYFSYLHEKIPSPFLFYLIRICKDTIPADIVLK